MNNLSTNHAIAKPPSGRGRWERKAPRSPEVVDAIVYQRDSLGWSWPKIAAHAGLTRQRVHALYVRWRDWARQ